MDSLTHPRPKIDHILFIYFKYILYNYNLLAKNKLYAYFRIYYVSNVILTLYLYIKNKIGFIDSFKYHCGIILVNLKDMCINRHSFKFGSCYNKFR